MQITWWISLALLIVLYIILIALVLPNLLFRLPLSTLSITDRGLKNYKEANGRSVVYRPDVKYANYVSQYILSKRGQDKVFLAKVDKSVCTLDYDIVEFNDKNKAFSVINVKEKIQKQGVSRLTRLSKNTCYVKLVINYANGIRVDKKRVKPNKTRNLLFALCVIGLTVGLVFFSKYCLASLYGDVFMWDYMSSLKGTFVSLAIALCIALVELALIWLHFIFFSGKRRRADGDVYGV